MIEKLAPAVEKTVLESAQAKVSEVIDRDKLIKVAENISFEFVDNTNNTNNETEKSDLAEIKEDQKKSVDSGEQTKVESGENRIIRVVETRNKSLEGDVHLLGVPFVRKIVDLGSELIEGVFPVFESVKDVQLPENLYKASDDAQGKYCTSELRKAIEKDPELAKQFNPTQLEQIKNGESKIKGLTWHHNEELGKMQLVDADLHAKVGHTGGGVLWAGRNE